MKKYIDADALIKEIELQADDCDVIEFQLAGYGCANIVKDFPAADVREVMASAWIPVSERLPEKDTECIITTKYSTLEFALYTGKNWVCECENFWTTQITAWMPMLEPYRGDE